MVPPGLDRRYDSIMKVFGFVLLGAIMAATLGVLFAGLIGLARGGDPMRSNVLMRWRVILQAAAIVTVALVILLMRR
jgi:hypothetical protein